MKTPSSAYISSFNDVTTNNLSECVYELLNKLKNASHVAIDFEFTGLCKPSAPDMNHRYIAMKEAVEKYSIVSFGVSIMKEVGTSHIKEEEHQQVEPKYSVSYECDNFNFLCKKESRIVFQEGNAEFLASTGFCFDRMNKLGIPFTPPGDIGKDDNFLNNKEKPRDTRLIKLWKAILSMLQYNKIPVIVHNGLHDIMYLYHSFIDKLPSTFNSFLHNLSQQFPSGFYDTKLLAIEMEFNSNFLSYVFAKTDRLRQNRFTTSTSTAPYYEIHVNKPIVHTDDKNDKHDLDTTIETIVKSVKGEATSLDMTTMTATTSTDRKRKKDEAIEVNTLSITNNNKKQKTKEIDICKAFAAKGWCTIVGNIDHSNSGKLHDLQRIMDYEMGTSAYPQVYTSDATQMKDMEKVHAAHFDAYMTAFVFMFFKHSPQDIRLHYNQIRLDFAPFALTIPNKSTKRTKQ